MIPNAAATTTVSAADDDVGAFTIVVGVGFSLGMSLIGTQRGASTTTTTTNKKRIASSCSMKWHCIVLQLLTFLTSTAFASRVSVDATNTVPIDGSARTLSSFHLNQHPAFIVASVPREERHQNQHQHQLHYSPFLACHQTSAQTHTFASKSVRGATTQSSFLFSGAPSFSSPLSSNTLLFSSVKSEEEEQEKQDAMAASVPASPEKESRIRISISDSFDGGNIQLLGITGKHQGNNEDGQENEGGRDINTTLDNETRHKDHEPYDYRVSLQIKPDIFTVFEQTQHMQYFSFKSLVSILPENNDNEDTDDPTTGSNTEKKGCAPVRVLYVIENANEASFANAWDGYTVCYNAQGIDHANSWRCNVGTQYDPTAGKLIWIQEHSPNDGPVYFSYYPIYNYNQHLALISKVCQSRYLRQIESLGQSLDGRDIELITVGHGSTIAWIIHRQHPGENMAEYYAEGLLSRLLGLGDSSISAIDPTGAVVDGLVHTLLKQYTIYIVPCMNPDGVARGHLRTNACGANLNREWDTVHEKYPAPSVERSPEVYYVLQRMMQTGCDLFLDIHGDEALPFNFISGTEGSRNWGPRLEALHGAFVNAYERANPDMQKLVGYTPPAPGVKLAVSCTASRSTANRFNCFAGTLEMPFKDCMTNPDPEFGWSPQRARQLGASVLDAMSYIQPYLRADGSFWEDSPDTDKYIAPRSKY